ncbi:hypothetical protein PT2222_170122 [Paraburkholderia tropica]
MPYVRIFNPETNQSENIAGLIPERAAKTHDPIPLAISGNKKWIRTPPFTDAIRCVIIGAWNAVTNSPGFIIIAVATPCAGVRYVHRSEAAGFGHQEPGARWRLFYCLRRKT